MQHHAPPRCGHAAGRPATRANPRPAPLLAPLLAPLVLAPALGGCSIISPVPTWELLKAVGSTTSVALSGRATEASNTVWRTQTPPTQVCLEYNPTQPLPDLLPALQIALQRHAVDSRVYPSATAVDTCTHWLRYAIAVEWDTPPLGAGPVRYLSHATLSLHRADGRVLASSEYTAGHGLLSGKFAATRDKLAPVVTALLTGIPDGRPTDRTTP